MSDSEKIHYLRWQGKNAGPFTLDEIRHKLRQRRIHSLYKVQVDGDWILLRDFLANKKHEEDEERKREAQEAAERNRRPPPLSPPLGIPVEDDWIDAGEEVAPHPLPAEMAEALPEENSAGGMGVASFILSLCFFIPFLNFFTIATSLIFGHLALSKSGTRRGGKRHAFPKFGLTTSYVYGGFLILTIAYLIGYHLHDAPPASKLDAFFSIHWIMFVMAVSACIGAGMLMLAVKMLAGYVPRFYEAYLAVLVPTAVGMFISVFVTSANYDTRQQMLVAVGIAHVVMLAVQALVWSVMIKNDDEEPLGFAYASVASLFYTITSLFITFLFVLLFTALT